MYARMSNILYLAFFGAVVGEKVSAMAKEMTGETVVFEDIDDTQDGFFEMTVATQAEAILAVIAISCVLGLHSYSKVVEARQPKVDKLGYLRAKAQVPAAKAKVEPKPSWSQIPAAESRLKPQPQKVKAAFVPSAPTAAQLEKRHELARLSELLQEFTKKGDMDSSIRIFEDMELLVTPPLPEYQSVITCCSRAGDGVFAFKFLKKAQEAGHQPNHITFNAVINAFAKQGEIKQALHVAGEMKRQGMEFDTITYNTIIDAWARAGDAATAQLWMKRMLSSGVKASVVTFGSVLRACAVAGLPEELDYWHDRSVELGIELNLICYSSVVNALARRDNVVAAMKWLTRMVQREVQPTVQCFTGILTAILNSGDVVGGARLVDKMRSVDVEPDGGVYSQLIVAALSARQPCRQMAQDWADECIANKCKLTRAAESGLISARLRIPNTKKKKKQEADESLPAAQEAPVTKAAPITMAPVVNVPDLPLTVEELTELRTKQQDCFEKRFVGAIKDFKATKFGYILCDELFALFKRDIFLCAADNPDQLAKGQRVTFTLRLDHHKGVPLPRAHDIEVCPFAAEGVRSCLLMPLM